VRDAIEEPGDAYRVPTRVRIGGELYCYDKQFVRVVVSDSTRIQISTCISSAWATQLKHPKTRSEFELESE